ncbi:RIP metalloprotease RseP [Gimibacter soli]|uniref:Zinc metalloprotease n=1 Tax=Gimibacter soli TaxID=3024400 RepID=A0AAE9XKL9_9PROT|nr:RIP metalloprotease RseP [Gimibacter soli]WCL52613.1 RIP metalloprotease RseP [Gimibacter soli]
MEATEAPGILLTIIAFVCGFSALVFIHEWGHYIVARIFGVKIESFSIGFGREVVGFTDKRGVRWKFGWLPLGGYVKFFGDRSGASNAAAGLEALPSEEQAACFHFKPVWQRALIVFAGPAVNLIAAALVFAAFYWSYGIYVSDPVVGEVVAEGAAAKAGIQKGDRILTVDGEPVERFNDIAPIVRLYPGRRLPITLEREGQEMAVTPVLGIDYIEDRFGNRYPFGVLGVQSGEMHVYEPSFFPAIGEGVRQTGSMIKTIFTTTGQMLLGLRSPKELGGPLRIVTMTGEAAQNGIENLLWFLAIISVNLGVINLLPIPVLDGGHLFYYAIEAIKGSPLGAKAQEAGFVAGFALMLLFMLFVTLNDLQSIAL